MPVVDTEPLPKKTRVRVTSTLAGVPEGTAGSVQGTVGFALPRHRVAFDNGRFVTSVARTRLVLEDEWDEFVAAREREAEAREPKRRRPRSRPKRSRSPPQMPLPRSTIAWRLWRPVPRPHARRRPPAAEGRLPCSPARSGSPTPARRTETGEAGTTRAQGAVPLASRRDPEVYCCDGRGLGYGFRVRRPLRWRGWIGRGLLFGLIGGTVLAAAAGARRTDSVLRPFPGGPAGV